MSHISELIEQDIDAYLESHQHKELLRFITCGSVDDGKSTLIGRLLYDSKMIFEDQLKALESDSKKMGTQGQEIDFALLVDGLAAEREQGITIDVAYRFFSTHVRKFIVADTPGHEQYTRNMVTGASTADVAIVLIDARKGILTQTRRHSFLVSLVGIKKVLLAINKMDLVNFDQKVFDDIVTAYTPFARELGITHVQPIPISALRGDNITEKSARLDWYRGPTLMAFLETVPIEQNRREKLPMRLPVQWVNRPNLDFRGYGGTLTSGKLTVGQTIRVQPSGKETSVKSLVTRDGEIKFAVAGESVMMTLADELDISRGNMISEPQKPAVVADQFCANLVWMSDDPLFTGRQYLLKLGTQSVNASITLIKHKVNVNTLEKLAADQLILNEVAEVNINSDRQVVFDYFAENEGTGSFILIDKLKNSTVAAGLINHELRRAQNIHPQHFEINKSTRASQNQQKPCVLWFTGLSGSGKSTIANALEIKLHEMGKRTYLLDGDNVRHGLNKDLGFTEADRVENIRRVAEVAKLMVDAGLIVITTFISPYRADREQARSIFDEGEFFEVFIDTPLEVCEKRDPKGLYKKARSGILQNFTGIDSDYEAPNSPDARLITTEHSTINSVRQILELLDRYTKEL